ncbi:MAG: hypothetical protein Ct9H300mP22_1400 [Gammaproteobacteria bacterium]|nr:MAG: hypothetical protein Ct9H300mP22_1400 [Gammaproteobacteria bacterium]
MTLVAHEQQEYLANILNKAYGVKKQSGGGSQVTPFLPLPISVAEPFMPVKWLTMKLVISFWSN